MSEYFKLYEVIANEAMMGFITFDSSAEHKCVYANKLGRELLEIHADRDLNEILLHDLYPEGQSRDMLLLNDDILLHEGLYQSIIVKKANGMKFISNVGVKKLHINNSDHILLMLQDVTLQKKLEKELLLKQNEIKLAYEELLLQNKQLKDLDIAKNRFIALTTHELRTPLSAMVGSAELLKEKLYDSEEQHDEFIDMIYEQGHHLMELVNDILDFAKIQAGKMDFFISNSDLSSLLQQEMEALQSLADQDGISLKYIPKETEEFFCYYDNMRLKQIIANILSNAIKYNKSNGSVEVSVEKDNKFVTVYVKDTGKGISQDQLMQVFNEFETLGKVANHQKGTGLGMPITKRLIEGMGGTIELKSELGVGTTFWIKIPTEKVLSEDQYRTRDDSFDLIA